MRVKTTLVCDECGMDGPYTFDRDMPVAAITMAALIAGWWEKRGHITEWVCPGCIYVPPPEEVEG